MQAERDKHGPAQVMGDASVIKIENLRVSYGKPGSQSPALKDVSLSIGCEKFGLIGESGSGKSTLARAIMGLLPPSARIQARRFMFGHTDLQKLTPRAYRRLRAQRMGMIPQDPGLALNPVMKVGYQIAETGRGWPGARRRQALAMLGAVNIHEAQRVYESYPHQLSGGMRQRALIAMALMTNPDLLIADEILSSLDTGLSLDILSLLDHRLNHSKMSLLFISHDINLVGSFCDRVAVMYRGRIVECLPASMIKQARHPYTRALRACSPQLGDTARRQRHLPVVASREVS